MSGHRSSGLSGSFFHPKHGDFRRSTGIHAPDGGRFWAVLDHFNLFGHKRLQKYPVGEIWHEFFLKILMAFLLPFVRFARPRMVDIPPFEGVWLIAGRQNQPC
jgi:hypothetical protein